jgi:hypothetical protein
MIHDDPLANCPELIAKLIRQRTLKIIKRELAAQGIGLDLVLPHHLRMACEAYFERHRADCVRIACDTIRMAAGLIEIAEREAQARAQDRALALAKGRDYDVIGSVGKH